MFKRITDDNDAQKARPLVPNILGMRYSSSIPMDQAGEEAPVEKSDKADGDQPSFEMPPFANGRDMRPRG